MKVSSGLLSLPVVMIDHVIGFEPHSAPFLDVVSRAMKQTTGHFLKLHAREIAAFYSREQSPLYRVIDSHYLSSLSDQGIIQFHLSVSQTIRSFGVADEECPVKFLSLHEIEKFNGTVHAIQDVNLRAAWKAIRTHVVDLPPLPQEDPEARAIPEENASTREIRTWMHEDPNQHLLQTITNLDLSDLQLTGFPVEIGLCTGLKLLTMNDNMLTSLHEGSLSGLTALEWLRLSRNNIHSLPGNAFQGLGLRTLILSSNSLGSLPGGIFQGLNLNKLYLSCNRFVSFPEDLFQGLPALEDLRFSYNQIASLPPQLFHGMPSLQTLHIHNNPLLVSFKRRDCDNNLDFREEMDAFFSYECRTAFAQFYQLAAGHLTREALSEPLFQLSPADKKALFRWVWEEAGAPRERDRCWGRNHVFDDMQIFARALKSCVKAEFDQLSRFQRKSVYERVHDLAQVQGESQPRAWGRQHVWDHSLILIDAMHMKRGKKRRQK